MAGVVHRATARRLGYPTTPAGLLAMSRDHEAMHAALAAWLGLPVSPTLAAVARGEGPSEVQGIEEDAVLCVQRLCVALGVDVLDLAAGMSPRAKPAAPEETVGAE